MSEYIRPVNPVNAQIGERIRMGRKMAELNQKQLGERLPKPITFQQIQKYERGINRISICTLKDIGAALGLPLPFFLEDLGEVRDMLAEDEWRLLTAYRKVSPEMREAMMLLLGDRD